MGDPKKNRRKYTKPSHPWQAGRLKEESELLKMLKSRQKILLLVILNKVKKKKNNLLQD